MTLGTYVQKRSPKEMKVLSYPDRVSSVTPALLAKLFDVADPSLRAWCPEELAAIYRHEISAPVRFDLVTLDAVVTPKLKALAEAEGLVLGSFQDLLQRPNPPVELLELTKEFAKRNRNDPDSALPPKVATILYFASIAAALLRCGRRISTLEDSALIEGFEWAQNQEWVDEPTRRLLQQGAESLRVEGKRHDGPA